MQLSEMYRGRENERITPIIASEVWNALENTPWWVKVKGKCYAPAELVKNYHRFQYAKIGDMTQVDPKEELARADRILSNLQKRRNDFEGRINRYFPKK